MQRTALTQSLLDDIRESAMGLRCHGKVADYIPELSLMSPELFALSCVSVDNRTVETGDVGQYFTMQSISKIISLSFAIEKLGIIKVFKYVGMEPTADSFNSLMRLEMSSPIPANPFMNAGAIVICALLQSSFKADAFDEMAGFAELMTGEKISFNGKVYESERSTADRNKALAHFMKSVGSLPGDVDGFLDLYFRQCSIMCTVRSLAKTGAMLASGGISPLTGRRVLKKKTVFAVLGLMSTCGLYNGSGEFAVRVGIPGKSGVSGGILAVSPGKMGIGVFSPPLDAKGNSVAGLQALELLSEKLDLRRLSDSA